MKDELRVLACQIDVPAMTNAADRDVHLAKTADRIRARLDQTSVDLVVLPELSSMAYGRDAFERLDVLSEPLEGPSFETYRDIAVTYGVSMVYGLARLGEDGCYISQVVLGPDGMLLGHFDKLHRAEFGLSEEKDFFLPGAHLFTFDCCGWRVAPIICYDIRFPELTRTLVLDHGADLILHCGAYGRDPSFDTWHAFVTTRASENQVPILSLNRAGALFGSSIFCGPWVDAETPAIMFPAHDEAFEVIDVLSATTDRVRQTYTFLQDRLPTYAGLRRAHGGKGTCDA